MKYVERDANGAVARWYSVPIPGRAEEELEDDHPDLLAYEQALEADKARVSEILTAEKNFSHGGKTLAELRKMTKDEFDTWWAANITTTAHRDAVLKLLARAMLRRGL